MSYNLAGLVVVGGIVPWLKSFASTPTLPDEYVECNGQTLSDAQSVFNGNTIPNLNASGGGTHRFLRGSSTSGSTGGVESHTHLRGASSTPNFFIPDPSDPALEGIPLCSLTTDANLPSYYEVCFCMRVK